MDESKRREIVRARVSRPRHIERTLVLCFMLLLLMIVIDLQLISVADMKVKGEQFWDWLNDWVR